MNTKGSDFGMQGLISIINDIQEVFSIVGRILLDLSDLKVEIRLISHRLLLLADNLVEKVVF